MSGLVRSRHIDLSSARRRFPPVTDVPVTSLAVIGDKAEQAYRRSDTLEKRRKLMEAWTQYCSARRRVRSASPSKGARAAG
jgi:hypothetical protein